MRALLHGARTARVETRGAYTPHSLQVANRGHRKGGKGGASKEGAANVVYIPVHMSRSHAKGVGNDERVGRNCSRIIFHLLLQEIKYK